MLEIDDREAEEILRFLVKRCGFTSFKFLASPKNDSSLAMYLERPAKHVMPGRPKPDSSVLYFFDGSRHRIEDINYVSMQMKNRENIHVKFLSLALETAESRDIFTWTDTHGFCTVRFLRKHETLESVLVEKDLDAEQQQEKDL